MSLRRALALLIIVAFVAVGPSALAQMASSTSSTSTDGAYATSAAVPAISNLHVSDVLPGTASVRWYTDIEADSRVAYGTSTAQLTDFSEDRCDGGGLVHEHCVKLSGLLSSVVYMIKAESRSAANTQAAYQWTNFTSAVLNVAAVVDTLAPSVMGDSLVVEVNSSNRLRASINFSEPINADTISVSSFYIKDSAGNRVSTDVGTTQYGAFALLPGPGISGMTYRLVVHGIKDMAGNQMPTDFISSGFVSPAPETTITTAAPATATTGTTATTTTTGAGGTTATTAADTVAPTVTQFDFRVFDGKLKAGVVFSEAIVQSTVSASSVYITDASGTQVSTQSMSGVSSAYTMLPGIGKSGVEYRLVVRHGIKDLAGNQLAADYLSPWFKSPGPFPVTTIASSATSTTPATTETMVEPNESAPRVLDTTATAQQPATEQTRALEDIGQSVRTIEKAQDTVGNRVSSFIESSVERKLGPVVAFSAEDRDRELERLKRAAIARGDIAADALRTAVAQPGSGMADTSNAAPVLRSSIDEIELLIKAESGVEVDLSLGSRAVTEEIAQAASTIADEQQKLQQRNGEDLYRDSDNDGVSDYDERHIYNTDPHDAFTGGSLLTDGERILLGLDARSASPSQVPVESPLSAGNETQYLFEVTDIAFTSRTASEPESDAALGTDSLAAGPSITTSTSTAAESEPASDLTVKGRALPNTFVTLYIFSTPIVVTVKADERGAWSYTLDKTLEDGEHTLYVAMVDNGGRIVAKSRPVPFIKTAEAASFVPLLAPSATAPGPLDAIRGYLIGAGIFAAGLFFVIALVSLGLWRSTRTRQQEVVVSNDAQG